MLTKTRTAWIIFLLYIVSVAISFRFTNIKYEALNFHTRDYAFYLQFASKLLDTNIAKSYSLNPYGENWLFFQGPEGVNSFHQSIHFEPVKYLYAVLFKFSNTPKILFLFASLVFFLPLLYIAFAVTVCSEKELPLLLLIAILYLLYPSSLFAPSYDLRPYIFLSPFFILSLLSIALSRPIWEQLLWFNAMFFAREEAIVLGLVLICYASVKTKESPFRRQILTSLFLVYSVWTMAILSFLKWTGYHTDLFQRLAESFDLASQSNAFIRNAVLLTSILVLLTTAATIFFWRRWRVLHWTSNYQRTLEIVSFSTFLLLLGFHFFAFELLNIMSSPSEVISQVFVFPRYHLYFAALLGLVMISLPYIDQGTPHTALLLLLSVLSVVFLWFNCFSPLGISKLSAKYASEAILASPVWALRNMTDNYQAQLLVDYSTHQAFYDYQYVYVYNRLPWHLIPGPDRFYPANKPMVQKILDERIEYVVVSRNEFGIVRAFIVETGLATRMLFQNDRYIAIQILRDQYLDKSQD